MVVDEESKEVPSAIKAASANNESTKKRPRSGDEAVNNGEDSLPVEMKDSPTAALDALYYQQLRKLQNRKKQRNK